MTTSDILYRRKYFRRISKTRARNVRGTERRKSQRVTRIALRYLYMSRVGRQLCFLVRSLRAGRNAYRRFYYLI